MANFQLTGTTPTNNFLPAPKDLKYSGPLDSRISVDEHGNLQYLINNKYVYPGMIVYVKNDGMHYAYMDTGTKDADGNTIYDWEVFSGDSAPTIPDGTINQKGIVQLSNEISDSVETKAATPKGVKAAINALDVSAPTASGNTTAFIDSISQTDGKISATKKNITSASTAEAGIVQLSSATDSSSESLAATPKAVKAAYDKANHSHPYLPDTTTYAGADEQGGPATSAHKVLNKLTIDLNGTSTEFDGSEAKSLTISTATYDKDIKLFAPFTITKDFGWYKIPSNQTSATVGSAGQSLREFLEGAFGAEDTTIFSKTPSISISMSNTGDYEIGSTITPSASWTTNAGTYKYGTIGTVSSPSSVANFSNKETGIAYSNKAIQFFNGTSKITSFTLTETTTISAQGTLSRSAVTYRPCSNLGKDLYSDLASEYKSIASLVADDSGTYTAYRVGCFYGAVKTANFTSSSITSAVIRGLNKSTYSYSSGQVHSFTVTSGATALIVACPSSYTGPSNIHNETVNAGMLSNFTKIPNITVGGADATSSSVGNNSATYNVWLYVPAQAYSSTADITITLG